MGWDERHTFFEYTLGGHHQSKLDWKDSTALLIGY